MDEFAREIGYAVLGVGLLAAIAWVIGHSAVFAVLLKIAALLLWGALTIGATAYFVLVVHLPAHNYGVATATVLVGAVLYVPWFIFGLPALLHAMGLRSRSTWRGSL